jgi:alkyl hydroperoxide reductase subunit AhpC
MFCTQLSWIAVIMAVLAIVCAGCPSKPPQQNLDRKEDLNPRNGSRNKVFPPPSERKDGPSSTADKPKATEPLPPPTIPKVNLSDELRANCLVKVGDAFPKADLPDCKGKTHSLASLYGKKLTVVCFWTTVSKRTELEAAAALRSLTDDVDKPYRDNGVSVIAIEVARNLADADAWQAIRATVESLPYPCLEDSKGQFLGKLCKDDKVPRVFLLDAEGKIRWFDVEYSRLTREELVQGIRVALGELK